jgi:hypothetical protein
MRARGLATFAIATALVAGCGDEDFERASRSPVPMELTGVIQDDKVTVSPSRNIGAGPFVITISNQSDAPHTVTLEGERLIDRAGSVEPLDTITIQRTLGPGSYEIRAGSRKAVPREIEPALLDVGAERRNSNADLLLP